MESTGITEQPVVKPAVIATQPADSGSVAGDKTGQTDSASAGDTTGTRDVCWLWWLALILLLVILYIYWRSRSGKNKRDAK